jgi:hypothetical protein
MMMMMMMMTTAAAAAFTVRKCKPNTTIGVSGNSAVENLDPSVPDTYSASSVISKPVTNNPV